MGMGSHTSKPENISPKAELDSYEAKLNVDLQTFQERTSNVIHTLAAGARSFNSRWEIAECLLEMRQDQEVIKVIIDCKDIWKNQDLFQDYFDNSQNTLDFCAVLEKSATDNHFSYSKALEGLKSFKNTFTDDYFPIFQSVYIQQTAMPERLQSKMSELDKKLKSIHMWQKLSIMIFIVTFSAVLICSVVVAAMAAHQVAVALAVATSIPVGSMGKWIDTLLKNYENVVRGQREVINSMSVGTYVTGNDLDSIKVLVDKLETEIESLLISCDFSAVEEIKKQLVVFMNYVEEMGAQADKCIRNIQMARTLILKKIIKHPNYG